MASTDVRESFPVLEDPSTQAGLPLHKVLEGDAAAAKNALAGLVAKDPSNNLIYLKTNADGELFVSLEQGDTACLTDSGEDEDGDNSAFSDLATIVLQLNKVYRKLGWVGSCFRDAIFQIVWVDDVGGTPTETILAEFVVGAGDYSNSQQLDCISFDTTGGTGVQNLVIRAKNANAASSLRGTVSIEEVQ